MKAFRIIVTDAEAKHHLAVTRSLGRRGIKIICVSHDKRALGFHSKYCHGKLIHPRPSNQESFVQSLLRAVQNGDFNALIPVGLDSSVSICEAQKRFKDYVKIPCPSVEAMRIASNKNRTMDFANKVGIPTPKTIIPLSEENLSKISLDENYPLVVKPVEGRGHVYYASNPGELIQYYLKILGQEDWVSQQSRPQIQEYVKGTTYGFFCLYNRGKLRALFTHKRIHELPPEGGPSTMATSVEEPELKRLGVKLFDELGWHGVGMAEFKKDEGTGRFRLIEINPKFWGSLDLAITAGVDFPYLLFRMLLEGDVEKTTEFEPGVVFRWIFPDFRYSIQTHRLISFLGSFFDHSIKNDYYEDDPEPSFIELRRTLKDSLLKSITELTNPIPLSRNLVVDRVK